MPTSASHISGPPVGGPVRGPYTATATQGASQAVVMGQGNSAFVNPMAQPGVAQGTITSGKKDVQAKLLQLHDIHSPAPVSLFWPIGYGWWLLALLIGFVYVCKKYNLLMTPFARLKLRLIARIDDLLAAHANDASLVPFATEISLLLRRLSLARFGQEKAALTGKAWLEFLRKTCPTVEIDSSADRFLLVAPFLPPETEQKNVPLQQKRLALLAKSWIEALR